MTHEEKINYMRIAAGIAGFGIKNEHLDLLVSVYELILEKKGKSDIEDVVKIESEVKHRADVKARSELLDKVSEKV
jgi:hypothetical protein